MQVNIMDGMGTWILGDEYILVFEGRGKKRFPEIIKGEVFHEIEGHLKGQGLSSYLIHQSVRKSWRKHGGGAQVLVHHQATNHK